MGRDSGPPRRAHDGHDWEARYQAHEIPWDTGSPDANLIDVIERYGITGGHALDIGCGTGTNAIWLAKQGFSTTGIDVSETAIELATEKANDEGVDCRLLVRNVFEASDFEGPYDFVYDRGCFHTFHETGESERFAERVGSLLKPASLWHSLIGSEDDKHAGMGPPTMTATQVTRAVEPYFQILELRAVSFDVNLERRVLEVLGWQLVARKRPEPARNG